MLQVSTITSKRQLTIPAAIFRRAKLKEGQKVLITQKHGRIQIEPAMTIVERLAGSVEVPARFQDLPVNDLVQTARKEHFTKDDLR